jgi:starch-binding outer membrane protein, SusD/RagB family
MTMKKNRLFIILFLGILITQITGCTKFVTVDPPVTQLVTSSVFENDQTAIAAMNGIYSFMESNAGFSAVYLPMNSPTILLHQSRFNSTKMN